MDAANASLQAPFFPLYQKYPQANVLLALSPILDLWFSFLPSLIQYLSMHSYFKSFVQIHTDTRNMLSIAMRKEQKLRGNT